MALETSRLTLLPCAPRQLVALIDDPHRFEDLVGWPAADGLRAFFVSGELSPDWVSALRKASDVDPWRHGFFVVQRDHRSVIGTAGFKGPPDPSGVVEIAYGIVPSFENRGYATEAAGALVDFAMTTKGVRLIRAHTLPEENASTHVLRRCGFEYVGGVVDPDDGPVWRWERRV
jgi:RimJ/RimL family protein N-acetyltransferase